MKGSTARYAPLVLLAIAAFLAPVMGGQLLMDLQPLEPGFGPALVSLLGGPEAALLSHAVVGALLAAAVVAALWRNKVLQLPSSTLLGLWTVLATLLFLSLLNTAYRAVSLAVLLEWLLCMGAFVAAAAISGHGRGPKVLLAAVAGGCTVVALYAIREYAGSGDPHWRVFATWINSNALSGMLAFGLFAALGFAGTEKGAAGLAASIAAAVIGTAGLMAQSRGGTLAVGAGLFVFLAATLAGGGTWRERGLALGKAALCLCAAVLLFLGLFGAAAKKAGNSGASASALSRVSGPSDQAKEQSSGFRMMLWKGALRQIANTPIGVGMGAYRFEGTRAGYTPQTQFAHESYLQLGVEANPLAPICLVLLFVVWLKDMAKGHRRMPAAGTPLRSAVLAAVAASAVHNLFDSDLYQFGIAFTLFLFMGVGLQLAADGLSPEVVPAMLRKGAAAIACVLAVLLGYMGWARFKASQAMGGYLLARAYAAQGDDASARAALESAQSDIETAVGAVPFDGELHYQQAFFARTREQRLSALNQAVALTPTPKYFRALAREHVASKEPLLAVADLQKALAVDPNNMAALLMLVDVYRSTGDVEKAAWTAQRLVEVEEKPYFTVRALPEVVPTESYSAREYLAELAGDPARKLKLLRPALDGRLAYLRLTYPKVLTAVKAGREHFAGENMADAREKLTQGVKTAEAVAKLYRAAGRTEEAEGAEAARREFEGALAGGD